MLWDVLKHLRNVICQSRFKEQKRRTSSTSKELLTMKYYLQGFVNQLKYEMVEVRTDNINLSHIVKKGSMKKHLHALAAQIFEICTQHDFLLNTSWITLQTEQIRRRSQQADQHRQLVNGWHNCRILMSGVISLSTRMTFP